MSSKYNIYYPYLVEKYNIYEENEALVENIYEKKSAANFSNALFLIF